MNEKKTVCLVFEKTGEDENRSAENERNTTQFVIKINESKESGG